MRIGELSRATGVSVRLLRYYEEQGLLAPRRTEGGHRAYGPDAAETVGRVRALLAAGLPTRVIRDVLPCLHGEGQALEPCLFDHLRGQLAEMDVRIDDLTRARAALGALLASSERAAA
ncbi:MerR family transcriptional regulator [Streptomyces avicenniae]|uniref:MerR family transcriptional regulator n=1 Tax=Streptomyces avicenniae TaxID=500153 RepID=UPI00069A5687|nr:MerR family transcriptional regulator [Streptomyces avicenniae]